MYLLIQDTLLILLLFLSNGEYFKTWVKGELVIKVKAVLPRSVFSNQKSNTFRQPKPFK